MRSRAGLFLCREAMGAPRSPWPSRRWAVPCPLRPSRRHGRTFAPFGLICAPECAKRADMYVLGAENRADAYVCVKRAGHMSPFAPFGRICTGLSWQEAQNPVSSGSRAKKGGMVATAWPRRALYFSSSLWKRRSTNSSRRSSVISSRLACSTAKAGSSGETSSSSPLLGL